MAKGRHFEKKIKNQNISPTVLPNTKFCTMKHTDPLTCRHSYKFQSLKVHDGDRHHFEQELSSSWDRRPFVHNRYGPKIGGPPPYQVASWSIQPFGHNRHRPKIGEGAVPFLGGELSTHLIQCHLGQGLPPYHVVCWCIQLLGQNRRGPTIGELCPFFGRGVQSSNWTSDLFSTYSYIFNVN